MNMTPKTRLAQEWWLLMQMLNVRKMLPYNKLEGLKDVFQPARLGRCSGEPLSLGKVVVRGAQVADQHCEASRDLAVYPTLVCLPVESYISHQKRTRSCPAQKEAHLILCKAELHSLALATVHIPYMEIWQAYFFSSPQLNPGIWALHSEVFAEMCLWCGTLDMNLLASMFDNKLDRFVCRNKESSGICGGCPSDSWRSVFPDQ